MTNVLILGATGRTGVSVLQQLLEYKDIQIIAGLRQASDMSRLPKTRYPIQTSVVDINNISSLQHAAEKADVIVNAIRMRGDIPETALVDLDKRIRKAVSCRKNLLTITVGGAGSLKMKNGKRFWQDITFPQRTLPRGRAHTRLRDYLEVLPVSASWAYLIPPPAYIPDGLRVGAYQRWEAANDETKFLQKNISYEDFATAVCDAVIERWKGVYLVAEGKQ
ncbi:NAD(P)-dependent oxidoreductase [Bacillus sp. SD088]|uniref:NAD(P)-dependent oxidoreductase n=1 Tax=Bacillus sp. SD088 TaxID=2782012 RepID=UPI001A97A01D|nr:NAD(P)H-binding protein [Bacillus sp. SD088]MBO0995602.1 NAD(P)H-binding protein [Bacillus sp. SD088]